MAVPKKKTSKSRTRRRFSQYAYKQKGKLERFVDQLTSINKPFIFDKNSSDTVATVKVDNKVDIKQEKKSVLNVEKVDKIEIKKGDKTNEAVKKDSMENKMQETESKKEVDKSLKEDKGKWFNNLFSKKSSSSTGMQNLNKGGSKKMFRRKAT